MSGKFRWFANTPNTDKIWNALVGGEITEMTKGRIPKMSPAQAAGLMGSWLIETGQKGLDALDVIEKGSGKGRGLSQYTGARRNAYEKARQAAIKKGINPNSAEWQLRYFAEEYMGKHDPAPGKSLSGWTKTFEKAPKKGTAADYAKYYTGSASEGKGYFRPGVPHLDRRQQAAMEVYNYYTQQKPKATTPAPSKGGYSIDSIMQLGRDVYDSIFNK